MGGIVIMLGQIALGVWWVCKGLVRNGITLALVGAVICAFFHGLLTEVVGRVRQVCSVVGIDAVYFDAKLLEAVGFFQAMVDAIGDADQLLPVVEVMTMVGVSAAVVIGLRITRWAMSFIPFVNTG